MITAIEELSLNAWPAHQTLLLDGWIIRLADGYTRRANSVNPIYPSSRDLDEKIGFCEAVYRQKKLEVVFKMTPAACPANLDERLESQGYRKDFPTSVQTLELVNADVRPARDVELSEELPDEWLNGFCRMSAVDKSRRESLQHILLDIVPQHCFAALRRDGKIIACGLGVLQSEFIGLFDIVTDEAFRGRGYGSQLVESLLAWAKRNGARRSYLQVMLDNPPALRVYSKIGYTEIYRYWYRIKK
jgi:N-acetylglutamate synthase